MAKKEIGDLEQIRRALEQWLADKLPDHPDVTLAPPAFPQASGESSVTLLLEAFVNNEQQRFVCRMKPLDNPLFADYDLPLQYRLMEIAAENDVPVPGLVAYEANNALTGSDFYMMQFTEGEVPADNPPFAFGSWVTELTAEQRALMWQNGLEALARIHCIDISAYDVSTLPCAAKGQSIVQHEIDKFSALLDETVAASINPVVFKALDHLRENAPQEGPKRLCWGDSRVGNVIWRDLQPAAIIDWEMASLCDPLIDVSWWYWIDHINSVGLGVERLSGLPERDALYLRWHELTGLPVTHARYYDLLNVVRFAILLEKKFIEAGLAADMGGEKSYASAFIAPVLQHYLAETQITG